MKVQTKDLIGPALDWAVAKCEGRTLREPIRGTNEEARTKQVPFTMYEVSVKQDSNFKTIEAWVSKIAVTRFGVNNAVGATAESISFTDSEGRQAFGSIDLFYFDRTEAELEVNGELMGYLEGFSPHTDPAQGHPIIERESIDLHYLGGGWEASIYSGKWHSSEFSMLGLTALIAAMRCYVASKLGEEVEEVEIPDELCGVQDDIQALVDYVDGR